MDAHNKDELEKYLKEDFIENCNAFKAGRTNDDMVDFCCICFALGHPFDMTYAILINWCNQHNIKEYERRRILDHYDRIESWLLAKEDVGFERGETRIMNYAINY